MKQALSNCHEKPKPCNDKETTPLLLAQSPEPPSRSTELGGYFYMVLSCIGTSSSALFIHIAEDTYSVPVQSMVFIRGIIHSLLSVLYIAAYLPLPQTFIDISKKQWKLLAFRGLTGGATVFTYFFALQKLPIGDAMTLFFCGPVFVIILSRIFLNETFTLIDAIAAITSFIGVVLIARPDFNATMDQNRIIGVISGLCAAFCSSLAYVTIRSIGERLPFMLFVLALASVSLLMSILLSGALGLSGLIASKEGAFFAAVSSLCGFAGQCFLTKGFQLCRAGPGGLIRNLDVPIAHVLGVFVLGESPTFLRMLGSMLVLFSAVMIGIRQLMRS